MSLFSLFRKSERSFTSQLENEVPTNVVDKELFVDDVAPQKEEIIESKSPITEFLEYNYGAKGYNDGYLFPNADLMESSIKKIGTDFRLIMDQMIDRKRKDVNELKLHMINTKGISQRLDDSLNETINVLENHVHQLDTQKILSIEYEGMIAAPVNNYRIGFLKGIEQYNKEKKFVGNIGLF